jgi:diguanylate cyclase (GGDEF)-like protein
MVLLAIAALAAGCWGAIRRWRDYSIPLAQLRGLLPQVHHGEVPIEELTHIGGGIESLVPLIQDVLRDLRREHTRNAILQEEMRQRVETRTESLERRIGSLQQQATRDGLTGLLNRRALDQQLPAVIEGSRLRGLDLTLLMIDVDYFKTLNDTLGHAAGDDLLRQIAQLIRSSIRETDMAFRCGGDEYVILLPGAPLGVGEKLSERLRSLVDGLAKTLRVPKAPRLSIGMTNLCQLPNATAEQLLAEADKALYAIKSARGSTR